jgi:hypothetical protein
MRTLGTGLQTAALVIGLLFSGCGHRSPRTSEPSSGHLYVTRKSLEADKLAAIWLIKRFVDHEASFQFVADDLPLTNGIPLDVPEAELRRYANNSCFETVVSRFKIEAPGLPRLSRIIRDIEINFWAEKYFPETGPLSQTIKGIIERHPNDPDACVRESSIIFDRLLNELALQRTPRRESDTRSTDGTGAHRRTTKQQ